MRLLVSSAIAAWLLASFPGFAEASPLRREVLTVRLEGYVGAMPADAPAEADWTVMLKGERYRLHVTKLRVLTGNVAYYEIITALKPYRPTLTISGEDEELDRFATAPALQKISINGFLDVGGAARYLMVSAVDYIGAPAPTPEVGAQTR